MSKKHEKVCRGLKYFQLCLIFISAVSGSISVFAFASLVGVPVAITSSAVWLKFCAITTGIKKYKSIITKKKKSMTIWCY